MRTQRRAPAKKAAARAENEKQGDPKVASDVPDEATFEAIFAGNEESARLNLEHFAPRV